MAEPNPTMARILDALSGARRVADIGCGAGGLSRSLAKRGFDVTGIDPQAALIAKARTAVPDARFVEATAQDMPLEDGGFDVVVILNALHHVPVDAMDAALAGCLRILDGNGVLVVVEPLARGSFFRAMQPVDDETAIRAHAIAALDRLANSTEVEETRTEEWEVERTFDGLDAFTAYLHRAEPARAEAIEARRDEVAASYTRNVVSRNGTDVLTQPLFIRVFRKT